jgi:hypothetical protein
MNMGNSSEEELPGEVAKCPDRYKQAEEAKVPPATHPEHDVGPALERRELRPALRWLIPQVLDGDITPRVGLIPNARGDITLTLECASREIPIAVLDVTCGPYSAPFLDDLRRRGHAMSPVTKLLVDYYTRRQAKRETGG